MNRHSENLASPQQTMTTGRDYPLENTAEVQVPNLVVNIEPNQQQPVTSTAASSHEPATTRPILESQAPAPNDDNRLRKWLVAYFTAIGIALQALETMKSLPELPRISQFHYFRTFLLMSLVYLTISAFVRPFSVPAAHVIDRVAVLFGFLAFILVITISEFPTEVIKVSSAIFIASLFIVFLATFLWRH